jgi:replicative DNA helicase
LPQSLDAEKGVLGSILLSPKDVLDECIKQRLSPKFFYYPPHALIYSTLLEMHQARKPIDLISLTQFLDDTQTLEQAGGASAITDLFTFVPTATNCGYYLEILREKHLLREVITVCTGFAARAYEDQSDVPMLLNDVEREVLSIAQDRVKTSFPTIRDLALGAMVCVEDLFKNRGAITGLPTGFKDLDNLTNGLQPGEMVVIAARPSMGKTALAMNIVEHVAVEAGKAVAVYSLEMGAQQIALRMLCSLARVGMRAIRDGMMNRQDMNRLMDSMSRLAECKLFIDDTPSLGVLEFQASARRLHAEHKLDLIVIDYLQLMRSPSRRGQENRQIEVAEISGGVKALAKELKIPVIVLAQLNRNPDARAGTSKGKPRLSDLRESGSIEQDADVVGLLWREAYYAGDEEEKKDDTGIAELKIEKNRNGETGAIPLTFLAPLARFESRAPESREPKR